MKRNSQVKQRTLSGENTSREEYSAPFSTSCDADLLFAVAEDAANGVLPQVETIVLSWEAEEDKRVAVVTVTGARRHPTPQEQGLHYIEYRSKEGVLWLAHWVHEMVLWEPQLPSLLMREGANVYVDGQFHSHLPPAT